MLLAAMTAKEYGKNPGWAVFAKLLQGAVTALIPPGLSSVAQGIAGAGGMTRQADDEMRNHFGTAVAAIFVRPDIGTLFLVSPLVRAGVVSFLGRIDPAGVDGDAARGPAEDDAARDRERVWGEEVSGAAKGSECPVSCSV